MYEDLARSQQRGPLEWLVVNMVIPSLLATFVLQARTGDDVGQLRTQRASTCSYGFLPIIDHPLDPVPRSFPLLIRMPRPLYPVEMRRTGIDGRVVLKGLVNTRGRVYWSSILVLAATAPQFVLPAEKALSEAVFRPARWEGRRMEAWVTVTVEFNLRDDAGRAR